MGLDILVECFLHMFCIVLLHVTVSGVVIHYVEAMFFTVKFETYTKALNGHGNFQIYYREL